MRFLNPWFNRTPPAARPASRPHRAGLALEMLEARLLLTVIFPPEFAGEAVVSGGSGGAINSAQVDVLFEGTSWNVTSEKQIKEDIQAIVGSTYLSKLSQYTLNHGDVQDSIGTFITDPTPPPENVGIPEANAILDRVFNPPHLTALPPPGAPATIYVIVTDPSETPRTSFNAFNGDTHFVREIVINPVLKNIGTTDNPVNVIDEDSLTVSFSHELAEGMAAGVVIKQPLQFQPKIVNGQTVDLGTQIADGEPEIPLTHVTLAPDAPNRFYSAHLIVNGSIGPMVQAYWSQEEQNAAGAFVVPDGGAQTVIEEPLWNGTEFTGIFEVFAPAVTTLLSSSVTSTGATFNAIVDPDGSTTNTFFEYSTDPNLPANVVTTLAGTAGQAGSSDGTGAAARLNEPNGVAVDENGNVYVADTFNDTIREITSGGVVTTLAGTAGAPGSVDGIGTAAKFDDPTAVAVDDAGNIYVADAGNDTIREIAPGGVVTTLAGTAGVADSADGVGAAAHFNHPSSVAVDGEGNVYVADTYNNTIREITPGGVVTTLAGTPNVAGSVDGGGTAALFDNPYGIAVDDAGNIYVGDTLNDTVREITPGGVVTTLAGAAGQAGNTDGTGAAARLNDPNGVAVDAAGNVYVADYGNHLIREITPAGVVTTLAGTVGETGGADGTGPAARFNRPTGVAVDGAGNVFVADTDNDTIRKLSIPSVSAQSGLTGANPVALSAAVTDLAPDTICYERVVATNAGGTTLGAILSFTTAVNPAVIQFSSGRFTADVTDGTAHVVLNRAGNLATPVTVVVSSSGGHDVSPFSETIAFGPNVLSQDVSISVVNDRRPDEADIAIPVSLSAPSSGAAIGAASAATLVIHDNNPLPPPPTILSVQHPTIKIPSGRSSQSVTVLQLQFSEPVKGAGSLADYALKSGKTKKGVTSYTVTVPLTSAVYNYGNSFYTAPRNTVTLFLKGKFNLATPERLSVIASSITDSFGQPLARHVVTINEGAVSIQ